LIVSCCPGECFERLGWGRLGLHKPHQHSGIERPDDFDDICAGREISLIKLSFGVA